MASVFLSYDREDSERARLVALALERAGHAVWWDLHIRGGEQYTKVIDEALKAADAVVVLWSQFSVESAWVRDEAAAGRDASRLVPVSLDETDPPLGFRQFQTIDLSRWKGRGKPAELKTLLADVDAMSRTCAAPEGTAVPCPAVQSKPILAHVRTWPIVAAMLIVLLGAVILSWRLLRPAASVQSVVVENSEPTPESRSLAHDLFVQLGSLQTSNSEAVRLVKASDASGADLIFEVGGNADAAAPRAGLALLGGKDRSLLWSKEFTAPEGQGADLRQQLGFTAARIIGCALEAFNAKTQRVSQATLKLYLNACANLAEIGWDSRPVIPILHQVIQDSPKFRPAWAKLITAEIRRHFLSRLLR